MQELKTESLIQDFAFKKQFGQNFLTDTNLLTAIANDAGITSEDEVLEIGAGAGALTQILCKMAKKVVSYEIDTELKPILSKNLQNFDNIELIFKDIMKENIEEIKKHFSGKFKIVANLPYYITTPIIFKFLESCDDIISLTIMVQKEVAERLAARAGTKDYGAITVAVNVITDAKITRIVNKQMFTPRPKVDSAIVNMVVNKNKYSVTDFAKLNNLIRVAFAMRRKTLLNNLKQGFNMSNEEAKGLIINSGLSENVRGEELTTEQFVALSRDL
ncbi:MAG: 16S rRNA (adenine(1518)-N(6)/adenine(1519)-N(6))-dimethyltransferase RsmA [Spirochaetales bacterium]